MCAIPIDNEVLDPIEVECTNNGIRIDFRTRNPWEGKLFVANRHKQDECKVIGRGESSLASIFLPFDGCGVKRERSVEDF